MAHENPRAVDERIADERPGEGAGLKMGTEGQRVISSLRLDVRDFCRHPLHRSARVKPAAGKVRVARLLPALLPAAGSRGEVGGRDLHRN